MSFLNVIVKNCCDAYVEQISLHNILDEILIADIICTGLAVAIIKDKMRKNSYVGCFGSGSRPSIIELKLLLYSNLYMSPSEL